MVRKLLFITAVVLFLSSGAFACIGHAQDFSQSFAIDAANVVARAGCIGSAYGSNSVAIGHAQSAVNVASGTSAFQQETARLTQSGSVVGRRGVGIVAQKASISGAQNQNAAIGWPARPVRSNGQSLGVSLDTLANTSSRIGGAVGVQRFVGAQSQVQVGPNGVSTAWQSIEAAQTANVSGSRSSVKNSLDVVLNQSGVVVGAK
ncbi:MAG: hypothetical protein P8Z79_14125 [Sedimentisphaerales bacterium]|jgi:hypothetical protein